MSDQPPRNLSRRQTIAGLGLAGAALAQSAAPGEVQEAAMPTQRQLPRHLTVAVLRAEAGLQAGEWVETAGFHAPGDGGAGLYHLQAPQEGLSANGADVIALDSGLLAVLQEPVAVNYRQFGALSDGAADDGVAVKLAHEYANRRGVPVINRSGEFWIKRTNAIPITTPVDWGATTFHIDERYNSKSAPRFVVRNDQPTKDLSADETLRQALLAKLRPGVQIIDELAPYAGHLVSVQDAGDRIGIRAGYEGNKGWAREELFYVEEEGRIIGDIAWSFTNLTSIRATPCNDRYLVIQGGGFYFSGDSPEGSSPGYHQHGIAVQRSRTIIREQWMGLEPGRRDVSSEPRSGFYVLNGVYDVTLENIRAMPWEYGRPAPAVRVQHGTYGLGGARMLNCTFRNLTAEGGWVAWGVFGTNLNKNFRIEGCRLNRIDVHFHCWNLYISDCVIGFKGISVTGGGELQVDETVRHGNAFISLRGDYGAKWDGPIRLRGCTLKPSGNGRVAVLSMRPSDFDYQYPIGHGTSVTIEDLTVDYSAAPASTDACWLMDIAGFSRNKAGQRLFFPTRLTFRDIAVVGREQGVRLLRIPQPYHYDLRRDGGCDERGLRANCHLVCERVQLERTVPAGPGDAEQAHLVLGGGEPAEFADARALYPKLTFLDCEDVVLWLGHCAAEVSCERCSVNLVTARALQGELRFSRCRLHPAVAAAEGPYYELEASLGVSFGDCTIHAPVVGGRPAPERLDQLGFIELNRSLRHAHLNTALGAEVMRYLRAQGTLPTAEFIARLRAQHALEG